jgi:hypothetical protein
LRHRNQTHAWGNRRSTKCCALHNPRSCVCLGHQQKYFVIQRIAKKEEAHHRFVALLWLASLFHWDLLHRSTWPILHLRHSGMLVSYRRILGFHCSDCHVALDSHIDCGLFCRYVFRISYVNISIITHTVLILIRIHRYRREFSQLLASASTTRSRFLRLFILSLIVLLIDLPLEIFWVCVMIPNLHAYSWTFTHSDWNYTVKVPTHGQILLWNHWIWVALAYVVFGFFGLVKDARNMYLGWLEKVGIGKILPSLVDQCSHAQSGRISSWTGKAKLLWGKAGFGTSTTPSSTKSSFFGSKVDSSASLRAGSLRFTKCSDILPTAATTCESQNSIVGRTKPKFSFRQFLATRCAVSQKHSTVAAAAEGDVEVGLPTIGDKEVA